MMTFPSTQPTTVVATPTPTPEASPEVAGVTFGDLLNKKRDYSGWLAGTSDGNVIIANPQNPPTTTCCAHPKEASTIKCN